MRTWPNQVTCLINFYNSVSQKPRYTSAEFFSKWKVLVGIFHCFARQIKCILLMLHRRLWFSRYFRYRFTKGFYQLLLPTICCWCKWAEDCSYLQYQSMSMSLMNKKLPEATLLTFPQKILSHTKQFYY